VAQVLVAGGAGVGGRRGGHRIRRRRPSSPGPSSTARAARA
jgi:hypothetical protein